MLSLGVTEGAAEIDGCCEGRAEVLGKIEGSLDGIDEGEELGSRVG